MPTLPNNVTPYFRTKAFDESSVPARLLSGHTITKPDVWARLSVSSGRVDYQTTTKEANRMTVEPGLDCIIPPRVPHRLEITGPVCFEIELLREEAEPCKRS